MGWKLSNNMNRSMTGTCSVSRSMKQGKLFCLMCCSDNRQDRARIVFSGATRCLISDFMIQNIIQSMTVRVDVNSADYAAALAALDKSYPWKRNKPRRQIASITATLGAELLIEYESVEVEVLR